MRKFLRRGRQLRAERRASGVAEATKPCQTASTFLHYHGKPNVKLEQLLEHSEWIATGTIVDAKQGLLRRWPSVLYELRVDSVLKGDPGTENLIFRYLGGQVQVDDEWLCYIPFHRDFSPEVSQRVLVFSYDGDYKEEWGIYSPHARNTVFEKSGNLVLAGDSEFASAPGFDEVVAEISNILAQGR